MKLLPILFLCAFLGCTTIFGPLRYFYDHKIEIELRSDTDSSLVLDTIVWLAKGLDPDTTYSWDTDDTYMDTTVDGTFELVEEYMGYREEHVPDTIRLAYHVILLDSSGIFFDTVLTPTNADFKDLGDRIEDGYSYHDYSMEVKLFIPK